MYIIEATYDGYDTDYDRKIESAVGSLSDGSGVGFGRRNLEWYRKTTKATDRIAKILRRFCRLTVTVEQEDW